MQAEVPPQFSSATKMEVFWSRFAHSQDCCLLAQHLLKHKRPNSRSDGLPPKRETRNYGCPVAIYSLGSQKVKGALGGPQQVAGGEKGMTHLPHWWGAEALNHAQAPPVTDHGRTSLQWWKLVLSSNHPTSWFTSGTVWSIHLLWFVSDSQALWVQLTICRAPSIRWVQAALTPLDFQELLQWE